MMVKKKLRLVKTHGSPDSEWALAGQIATVIFAFVSYLVVIYASFDTSVALEPSIGWFWLITLPLAWLISFIVYFCTRKTYYEEVKE